MKKNLLTALMIVFVFSLLTLNTDAKEFKGVITYKVSYPGAELNPQMKAMLPKVMTYIISGNMARTEIELGGMGKQIEIINGNDHTTIQLFDMMGQKFYIKKSREEIEAEIEKDEKAEVQLVDETKEIAGYECKKAIITVEVDGKKNSFNIYYSPELGSKDLNFDNNLFNQIDGVLMEFEFLEGNMSMKMEAISVKKKKIKSSAFEIPEGFKETSEDELRNNFGGGM